MPRELWLNMDLNEEALSNLRLCVEELQLHLFVAAALNQKPRLLISTSEYQCTELYYFHETSDYVKINLSHQHYKRTRSQV